LFKGQTQTQSLYVHKYKYANKYGKLNTQQIINNHKQ